MCILKVRKSNSANIQFFVSERRDHTFIHRVIITQCNKSDSTVVTRTIYPELSIHASINDVHTANYILCIAHRGYG